MELELISSRLNVLYVFTIDDERHRGAMKVGQTSIPNIYRSKEDWPKPNSKVLNEIARKRVNSYTTTAGTEYELEYTQIIDGFTDKAVHAVFHRSGIKQRKFDGAQEWFECTLEDVRRAVRTIERGRQSFVPSGKEAPSGLTLRKEQKEAVRMAKRVFEGKDRRVLWNAKMRFGKTISALSLVKEMGFKRTLILTHRPVVSTSWEEDFYKVFLPSDQYTFGSRKTGEPIQNLQKLFDSEGGHYIYFVSMQDLRGSAEVGGLFDKNEEIFQVEWDLIIIDEAHEGTQTELGQKVIEALMKNDKTKELALSGTPFNLYDNYEEKHVYTWDYIQEQRAKVLWEQEHPKEYNPYLRMPVMNIYTYDIGEALASYQPAEVLSSEDFAFNFREFFRVVGQGKEERFKYDRAIDDFLNLLCDPKNAIQYPFSTEEFRQAFHHTFWLLPGVASARLLSRKLQAHRIFGNGNFGIVNIAGDGDEEIDTQDALTAVRGAIDKAGETGYTITLSCGRLTTGVTVPEWTAVLMLSGSQQTAVASYMQTIFRVQTPYEHEGKLKTDCYVFDFAPDRTLRMLSEMARVSTRPGNEYVWDDKVILGEFLNFCPVIACQGSEMKEYKVDDMMEQLKRVYVERVVSHGFEDSSLYSNELFTLNEESRQILSDLRQIIGTTQSTPKLKEIDVNKQGMTEEEYLAKKAIERRQTTDTLSPEELAKLEELRKKAQEARKERDTAISILRGISIRLPLLIYGARMTDEEEDQKLSLENFTQLVDDVSWAEFMPKGVDKQRFNELRKFYDQDIFRGAGKRIRQLVRQADELTIEERIQKIANIFATFRNPDKETVLTPWRVVNLHLSLCFGGYRFFSDKDCRQAVPDMPIYDEAPERTTAVFYPETLILEINSKSGLYPLYVAYSVYRSRLEAQGLKPADVSIEQARELWAQTLRENILVLCRTEMAESITRRTLTGFTQAQVHVHTEANLIEQLQENPNLVAQKLQRFDRIWSAFQPSKKDKPMKIDAVVGNPPYHIATEDTSDASVYHLFIDLATRLAPRVSLITPARYLFNAGKTPKEWNQKVLNDEHYKVIGYWVKSNEIFPAVDIKGGVAIMYRDENVSFGKIGIYVSHQELNQIYKKVRCYTETESLTDIIYPQNKFQLDILLGRFPHLKSSIGSNGTERRLTTSIFALTELFKETRQGDNDLKILGLIDNQRVYRYTDRSWLEPHPNLEKYKVIVPKSNGSGAIGEVLSTPLIGEPLIGEPLIGVTQTFLTIGAFDTRGEAEACLKYIKTRFARTLLGILKATQHNPKETWRLIPLQDFTAGSDIDWSQSVAVIDEQLFDKYGLSEEERVFIRERITAMD